MENQNGKQAGTQMPNDQMTSDQMTNEMKAKRKSDMKSRSLIIAGLLGWTMLTYQNCSPEHSVSGVSSLGSVVPGSVIYTESGEELPDLKPVGVDYSENMLISMRNQLGVATVSNQTMTTYNNAITMVPESGRAASVTAPMWTAVTNISGEVCQDLITQEKAIAQASRRIFPMVDFTKAPNALTDASKSDVIRRLARSVWARNESADEKAAILSAVSTGFAATTVAQTENQMIFICTSMLASLDARKQ